MLNIKKPKLKEILPKVFLVTFNNQYDLALTFCRFQEYYESPKFRGKQFSFMELMRYYALNWGRPKKAFSYPKDWNGFNVPGSILRNCLVDHFYERAVGKPIKTDYITEYDELMLEILDKIVRKNNDWSFYLIGVHTECVRKERDELIAHESAHGLFTTNAYYREEMEALIDKLPKRVYTHLKKVLLSVGYSSGVIDDEIHAYMSAGLRSELNSKLLNPYRVEFKKILRKYGRKKLFIYKSKKKKRKIVCG